MLSPTEISTLRAAIIASTVPVVVAARTAHDSQALADYYSADASPAVPAWSTNVDSQTMFGALNIANYDSVLAGKRDAFRLMMEFAPVDATKNQIRKGIVDIFVAADAAAMLNAMTVNANNLEVVFGGNSPASGGVTALKRNYVGDIDELAMRSVVWNNDGTPAF